MKLHDGDCRDFTIDHADLPDANAWDMSSADQRLIQPDAPVIGWRYMVVLHVGGTVIHADGLDADNTALWDNTITAPRAECDPAKMGPGGINDAVRRLMKHGPSPDPDCECGYRVVRSVTELTRFLRWAAGRLADFPVTELPDGLRAQVDHLGDMVSQSVVVLPVLGCGHVAVADYEHYRDPDGTLRVEYFASIGKFITAHGDPVADALTAWGADVVVVPEVHGVHEPGDCAQLASDFAIWKLGPVRPVTGVVLAAGDSGASGDGWTETGRWGFHGSAGAAIVSEGKVLLVWSGSRWQLPGGALMAGESVGECVVRETAEETGVDLAGVPVRFAFERSEHGGWSYTTVVVDAPAGVAPVADAEVSDWGWFDAPPVGTHPDLIDTWDRIMAP